MIVDSETLTQKIYKNDGFLPVIYTMNPKVTVHVMDTLIRYTVPIDNVCFPLDHEDKSKYCVGEIVETCLGKLLVEEIRLNEYGCPTDVYCIVPNQMFFKTHTLLHNKLKKILTLT